MENNSGKGGHPLTSFKKKYATATASGLTLIQLPLLPLPIPCSSPNFHLTLCLPLELSTSSLRAIDIVNSCSRLDDHFPSLTCRI